MLVVVYMYVSACDGVHDDNSETNACTDWKDTLESGLQVAVSWASLLCVYMVAMAFQNCMLSIFFPMSSDLV